MTTSIRLGFEDTDRTFDIEDCPHCMELSENKLDISETEIKPIFVQRVAVVCNRCGMQGPEAKDVAVTGDTYQQAVDYWNELPR